MKTLAWMFENKVDKNKEVMVSTHPSIMYPNLTSSTVPILVVRLNRGKLTNVPYVYGRMMTYTDT